MRKKRVWEDGRRWEGGKRISLLCVYNDNKNLVLWQSRNYKDSPWSISLHLANQSAHSSHSCATYHESFQYLSRGRRRWWEIACLKWRRRADSDATKDSFLHVCNRCGISWTTAATDCSSPDLPVAWQNLTRSHFLNPMWSESKKNEFV